MRQPAFLVDIHRTALGRQDVIVAHGDLEVGNMLDIAADLVCQPTQFLAVILRNFICLCRAVRV